MISRAVLAFSLVGSLLVLPACISSAENTPPVEEKKTSSLGESPISEVPRYEPQSWSTVFSRESLRQAAMGEVERYFSSRDRPNTFSVEEYFDPELPELHRTCSSGAVEKLFNSFSLHSGEEAGDSTILLIGGLSDNQDWIVETARSIKSDWPEQVRPGQSLSFPDWLDAARAPADATYGYGERNAIVIALNISQYGCGQVERLAYHEAFHSLSARLDGKSLMGFSMDEMAHMGLWFREGSADFFSESLAALENDSEYVGTTVTAAAGEMTRLTSMEANLESNRAYTVGQFALEYIVANVGVEAVLDVYRGIGRGLTFYEAFEEGVGIPTENFYNLVEQIELEGPW
jgi:hypothetical protein